MLWSLENYFSWISRSKVKDLKYSKTILSKLHVKGQSRTDIWSFGIQFWCATWSRINKNSDKSHHKLQCISKLNTIYLMRDSKPVTRGTTFQSCGQWRKSQFFGLSKYIKVLLFTGVCLSLYLSSRNIETLTLVD